MSCYSVAYVVLIIFIIYIKKLKFIGNVNGNGSKTAKNHKGDITINTFFHCLNVIMLLYLYLLFYYQL